MDDHKDKALQLLSSFKDSEAKKALEQLVLYTIERKK
jgi:geranylgeranyl pyrophosphate synthase